MKIDFKELADLAAHTFTKSVTIFMLLGIGYSLSKTFTSDDVPVNLFVSLVLLFLSTLVEMIVYAFGLLEEKVNAIAHHKQEVL